MFSLDIADGVDLRPLEVWHAPAFAEHLDRAREHIRPWVGPAFVTDTVDGAQLIGGVMFVSFDASWGICEIGCWLEPAAEGRGLVTRSVAALLDWAFVTRGLTRAEWRCRTDNERSVAVARRLGMRSEGVLRSTWLYDGQHYDKEVFSILRSEWLSTKPPANRSSRRG